MSLAVYRGMKNAFERCEGESAPFLNITAIFFHDLMRILSGYALRQFEVNGPFAPPEKELHKNLHSCPYFGFADVFKGIDLQSKRFGKWKENARTFRLQLVKRTILSNCDELVSKFTRYRAKVWADPIGATRQSIKEAGFLVDNRWPGKVRIPNLSAQLSIVAEEIENALGDIAMPIQRNLINEVVRRHIDIYVSEGSPEKISHDVVLFGTPFFVPYRLMSAMGRYSGAEVVGVVHGEADGVYDEPWVGYGERAFAGTIVGYGPAAEYCDDEHGYRKGFYGGTQYIPANSNVVRETYKGPEVSKLGDLSRKKILYVPSQLYGQRRYGPFHTPPDQLYLSWQNHLFREFPDMIFKAHPKEIEKKPVRPANIHNVEHGQLSELFDEVDVFFYDILSGAAWEAAATGKPVVYFDLGLRNLTNLATDLIDKRIIRIRVNPFNPGALREMVEARAKDDKVNEFTSAVSLAPAGDLKTRNQAVLSVLKNLT